VHESARAYFDWLFGGTDAARRLLGRWLRRPSSEVALERVTLLEREAVVGAYIALSGADLVACRKADVFALLAETERASRVALAERLRAVRSLFAPVGVDEWYLSKLSVAPEEQRRGLGDRLVEAYLRSGEGAAFKRYRLDVDADNAPAIKLYESHGFRVIHDATSDAAGMRYLGMAMEA
jgi:ribosomal protein S18 acetylase RimI-like enzyme